MSQSICTVTDCDRKTRALGYCNPHYLKYTRHGDPLWAVERMNGDPCTVEHCEKVSVRKGWCLTHYGAWRRYARAPMNGYVTLTAGGRRMLEHRYVMEQVLGRRLLRDENVHHINGVKYDNRPENLELWTTMQPAGQRVSDQVAWAKTILARYDH